MTVLQCAGRKLDLSTAQVMGILNVTPDSFSDGGSVYSDRKLSVEMALRKAIQMVDEGATLIDIGGESTRPGADPVPVEEELERVIPVVERLSQEIDVILSVDTSAPEVMRAAADAGAGLLNDVRSFSRPGAFEVAASTELALCVMHMQGSSPATMQLKPEYEDVTEEVEHFLQFQLQRCSDVGIAQDRLLLDPGFGFGKTLQHNLELLNRMERLQGLGAPLLVGTSRKSMVGMTLNKPVDQRLYGSLATVALAISKGAKIIRAHDVAPTVDVVRMTEAVINEKAESNG
ncbi:dihydropteroate synthase [Marinobacterium sediminicola]|uniref:Dihydropteroate synthase n=1 Tax=Marinobacterium sediminicola TaxID=518898 RepID=A0ABY1S3P0_9GAMM|nr:dihydropteroate synthase [Marinobacterium sediminicola]ULG68917.1 dihydropteroate synthase [Marinobacterium sediminicola]SMR77881.1 dihydropteroate synthase [Marinobacterium sediminicola]